jgi:LCP family protein required for cell wall assembly
VQPSEDLPSVSPTGRRRSLLRRSLLTGLAFAALLGVTFTAVVGYVYRKYDGQIHRISVLQTKDPSIKKPEAQARATNFLIIGSDSRQGANTGYGHTPGERSDTTILIHLAADHRRATVISIPRDSWVEIPQCIGVNGKPIPAHHELFNSAFSIGGARCTVATVQRLTGIAVTHYLQIDFAGFKKVVDALGTVTICSPEPVYDANTKLSLRKGNNPLNGAEALSYVRAREALGDGSDLGRIKRQQQFLGVVLRQAMSGALLNNPSRLTGFLDATTRSITVDTGTTFGDLRRLAGSLHGLNPKRVVFYTAPIANPDYTPPGYSSGGKVLLDAAKGAVLYGSIIDDTAKKSSTPTAAAPKTTGTTTTGSTTTGTTSAPKPNANAGDKTCSL